MPYEPQTLAHLEACGVTPAQMDALVRFLRCGENGSYTWHVHQGKVERCELRLTFAARATALERVGACVGGDGVADGT